MWIGGWIDWMGTRNGNRSGRIRSSLPGLGNWSDSYRLETRITRSDPGVWLAIGGINGNWFTSRDLRRSARILHVIALKRPTDSQRREATRVVTDCLKCYDRSDYLRLLSPLSMIPGFCRQPSRLTVSFNVGDAFSVK